jgi:hypothetical protein
MTLSGERAQRDFDRVSRLVEDTIRRLGIDPASSGARREGHAAYALRRGSARILVAVHAPSDELPEGRFRVVAPVVRLPEESLQLRLFRYLLEANSSELVACAFAINGQEIVIVAERPTRDLDPSEVERTIRDIGRLADRFDDELASAFGTTRSGDSERSRSGPK